jgi:Protein of unknown function (DUF4246)
MTSYINNLHPHRHQELYSTIEQIIDRVIPMWNQSLSMWMAMHFAKRRIDDFSWEYEFNVLNDNATETNDRVWYKPPENEQWSLYEDFDDDEANRRTILPEPGKYRTWVERTKGSRWYDYGPFKKPEGPMVSPYAFVNLQTRKELQIIVKLANIHLTPEKPTYAGGSWHVEGQLNEHICASAIYYYDCENITESRLAFRGLMEDPDSYNSVNENEHYHQGQFQAPEEIYGFRNNDTQVLAIGDVVTRQGRVITFPNSLQHQVQPFSLEDSTRPGHRKILALFLVDPNAEIISTAHVPCQQADWWMEYVRGNPGLDRLPNEMLDGILDQVGESLYGERVEEDERRVDERKERSSREQHPAIDWFGFQLVRALKLIGDDTATQYRHPKPEVPPFLRGIMV